MNDCIHRYHYSSTVLLPNITGTCLEKQFIVTCERCGHVKWVFGETSKAGLQADVVSAIKNECKHLRISKLDAYCPDCGEEIYMEDELGLHEKCIPRTEYDILKLQFTRINRAMLKVQELRDKYAEMTGAKWVNPPEVARHLTEIFKEFWKI